MKKRIAAVFVTGMVLLSSMTVSARVIDGPIVHTHMLSHNYTGSTYQALIRTESRVYMVLADGTVYKRPYLIYGIYQNCEQRCGCGYSIKCADRHLVRIVGGWAY